MADFEAFNEDGYHTQDTLSSSPPTCLCCPSEGPEVPISSSPGHNPSDPSPVYSYECAYSLSDTDSNTTARPLPRPFAQDLSERLLFVASERHGSSPGSVSNTSSETKVIGECAVTPEQTYRILKRPSSGDGSFGLTKYRKLVQPQTAPATPVPVKRWGNAVPSIAPPDCYVPRLPLAPDTAAKIRLGRYLEREGRERVRDGLIQDPNYNYTDSGWDADGEGSSDFETPNLNTFLDWERLIGIRVEIRNEVIDWLTTVLPRHASGRYTEHNLDPGSGDYSANSSFSSTSSTTSCEVSNLYDQLVSCPKTRFHAVWMFLRYFWTVAEVSEMSSLKHLGSADNDSTDEFDPEIWDKVVACLALSVKAAQRDVLKALDFSLGDSPQAILDELWIALPSLRQALNFDGGWNAVQKEVWFRLFDIIYAPDVLQYAQSRLVGVALIDSLVPCLASRYEYEAVWHVKAIRRARDQRAEMNAKARFRKRAVEDAEGIISDIQAVVGITDEQLTECRAWWDEAVSAGGA
ncbi:hypothetical protein DFP72DRAFT_1115687 [Ephemerocybe angulata]|uniref:Uncharacterized protein n=1 Tax=Ephemerocybe angulata TaxID=980116 RepID=A0A8H6I181_9AGAR|nr:hypothetical protein DFP72DRAFT_1115687 [Tulosesus angulatus]